MKKMRMAILTLLAIMVVCLTPVVSEAGTAKEVTFKGVIVDDLEMPIAGETITLVKKDETEVAQTTNSSGTFSFSVPAGEANSLKWGKYVSYSFTAEEQESGKDFGNFGGPVREITMSEVKLAPGEIKEVPLKTNPVCSSYKNVTWESDDTDIVTVENGTVKGIGVFKGIKEGKTTVTISATNYADPEEAEQKGLSKIVTTIIYVTVAKTPVTGVELDQTRLDLKVNQLVGLTATVKPEDATDKTVSWKSSDPDVATVTQEGKVTAIAAGIATITVTTKDGSFKASCRVAVTGSFIKKDDPKPQPEPTKEEPVLIAKTVKNGERKLDVSWNKIPGAVKYSVYAIGCGSKELKTKSLKIATVKGTKYTISKIRNKILGKHKNYRVHVIAIDKKGRTIAKSPSCHVATGGYKKDHGNTIKITVSVKGKESPETLTVRRGTSCRFKAKLKNYKNKKTTTHEAAVRYITGNAKVAKISQNGTLKAVGRGTCTVYAVAISGVSAKVKVTVE